MAAKLLLPGNGGKYTSEVFAATDTAGADTIDISRCAQFAVQIVHDSGTPTGDVQIEHSLDNTNWAALGSAVSVTTNGTMALFDVTDGPFGLCRINPTGLTAGTVKVLIVGWPVQMFN